MPFFHLLSSQTRTHKRTHSREMKHGSYFPSNEKKETVTKELSLKVWMVEEQDGHTCQTCNTCDGHVDIQNHARTHTCTASSLRTFFTSGLSCHTCSCCLCRLRCPSQLNFLCERFSVNSCRLSARQQEQDAVAYMCFCVRMLFKLRSCYEFKFHNFLFIRTPSFPERGTQWNTSSSKTCLGIWAPHFAHQKRSSVVQKWDIFANRQTNKYISPWLLFTPVTC